MRWPLLSILPIALLAALLLPACGGGDDDRAASVIHRMLVAAGTDESGTLESFPGRLPDDLPAEPPQYPGANLIVSSRQVAPFSDPGPGGPASTPQPLLFFIVLDTPDSRNEAFAYYEEALDEDPWQLEGSFSTEQLDTLQFLNVGDVDITGTVSIATGGADGHTSILISLQDAGSLVEEPPPFELGESLSVPKSFPADVPLYAGATITATAFFREPARQSFLIVFLTTDSQDEVIEFYRQELEANGLTVLDAVPIGLEERIDFRDAVRDIQGEVIADRFSESRDYTEVSMQVQLNPAREPADRDVTPQPAEDTRGGATYR